MQLRRFLQLETLPKASPAKASWTAARRREVSVRMKKYWAGRRRAASR